MGMIIIIFIEFIPLLFLGTTRRLLFIHVYFTLPKYLYRYFKDPLFVQLIFPYKLPPLFVSSHFFLRSSIFNFLDSRCLNNIRLNSSSSKKAHILLDECFSTFLFLAYHCYEQNIYMYQQILKILTYSVYFSSLTL
jgi:hypothetical protein